MERRDRRELSCMQSARTCTNGNVYIYPQISTLLGNPMQCLELLLFVFAQYIPGLSDRLLVDHGLHAMDTERVQEPRDPCWMPSCRSVRGCHESMIQIAFRRIHSYECKSSPSNFEPAICRDPSCSIHRFSPMGLDGGLIKKWGSRL